MHANSIPLHVSSRLSGRCTNAAAVMEEDGEEEEEGSSEGEEVLLPMSLPPDDEGEASSEELEGDEASVSSVGLASWHRTGERRTKSERRRKRESAERKENDLILFVG